MISQHFKGCAGVRLTACIESAPAVETTGQTGSDLRVDGIKPTRLFCEKAVTAAVKGVESHMVCLLYTSPSPRDGLLSRMPSSA